MHASLLVATAAWMTLGSATDVYARAGLLGLLAPVFKCPLGTPILLENVQHAPIGFALHLAWATAFIANTYISIRTARAYIRNLLVAVVLLYVGGQLVGSYWLVACGCVAEWALLTGPYYICAATPEKKKRNWEIPGKKTNSLKKSLKNFSFKDRVDNRIRVRSRWDTHAPNHRVEKTDHVPDSTAYHR